MDFSTFIQRVKDLNLPLGTYAVIGGGVLLAHNIRNAKDIDIVALPETFDLLKKRGWKRKWFFWRMLSCKAIQKDGVEIYSHVKRKDFIPETIDIIKRAEIVEGIPFMTLQDLSDFKKAIGREKDFKDIELIKNYLGKNVRY